MQKGKGPIINVKYAIAIYKKLKERGNEMKTKAIRKLASLVLTAALISGAACAGGGQDLYAYAASTWDAAEGQTLTDAIASADAVHTKQQTQSGVFENFKKLLNNNTAATAKISKKEVESPLSNSGGKNSLTYK